MLPPALSLRRKVLGELLRNGIEASQGNGNDPTVPVQGDGSRISLNENGLQSSSLVSVQECIPFDEGATALVWASLSQGTGFRRRVARGMGKILPVPVDRNDRAVGLDKGSLQGSALVVRPGMQGFVRSMNRL